MAVGTAVKGPMLFILFTIYYYNYNVFKKFHLPGLCTVSFEREEHLVKIRHGGRTG